MAENPNFKEDLKKLLGFVKGLGIFGVVIVLGLYIATGIYTVGPDEEGVLLLFGKFDKTSQPGINWYYPRPFGEVYKVRTRRRHSIELGYRLLSPGREGQPAESRNIRSESYMLTGDENIVMIDATVMYEIMDAKKYLFNVRNPEAVVKHAAESAIRQVVGSSKIDTLLTEGRMEIQGETRDKLQETLDYYESGIRVFEFLLQDVKPPVEVEEAFKDVTSAREDRQRFIQEAERYRNEQVQTARGRAAEIIQQAEGYKAQRVNDSQGDVARFLEIYKRYDLGKEVTKTRLYLETMERIMPNIDKIIIDEGLNNGVLNILNKEGGLK